jgi:hypothetical protein
VSPGYGQPCHTTGYAHTTSDTTTIDTHTTSTKQELP